MNDKKKKILNNKNLVSDFIEKRDEDTDEPSNKKNKLADDVSADDSLKFFKSIKKSFKISNTEAASSSSSSSSKTTSNAKKSKEKTKLKKTKSTKAQPDIRKALSKQDFMLQNVLDESCTQDNVDPYEMQLALAISESLKDQQNTSQNCEPSTSSSSNKFSKKQNLENPFIAGGKVQLVNSLLEKYGFKRNKAYTEYEIELIANCDPKKRSKFKKFPTALTRTTKEEREQMISERVDNILDNCFLAHNSKEEDGKHSHVVYSYFLQEMHQYGDTVFYKQRIEEHSEKILMQYYVADHFQPSYVKVGHLLKDWNCIFGRDFSPDKEISKNTANTAEEIIEKDQDDNKSCSDIFDGVDSINFESSNESVKSDSEEDQMDRSNLNKEKTSKIYDIAQSDDITKASQNVEDDFSTMDICENEKPRDSVKSFNENEEKIEILSIKSSGDESTIEYSFDENKSDVHENSIKDIKPSCSNQNLEENYHIDLTQDDPEKNNFTEDCIDLTQHLDTNEDQALIKCKNEIIDLKDGNEEQDNYSTQVSQNSASDEVIDISDDEINYSIQAFNNDNNYTQVDDVLEIDNIAEQSLMDLMAEKNDRNVEETNEIPAKSTSIFDINDSVNLCMSGTKIIDNKRLSHQLSSSIMEILNKYKDSDEMCSENLKHDHDVQFMEIDDDDDDLSKPSTSFIDDHSNENVNEFEGKDKEKNSSISDSSITEILRKYKILEKENEEICKSQNNIDIIDDEKHQEDILKMNSSIRKSLNNILNSPSLKSVKKKNQAKPRKRSLGINLNDKYIVDTESNIIEPYFSSMTPVELKKELCKFGIRTLPVKKAVELLTHIFEQMHPIIRVKALEEVPQNDSRIDMNFTDFATNIGIQDKIDEFVFQLNENGIIEGEEYILPKMKKSKTLSCAIPLHISFYNMVRSNQKYQKFILEFRPLDLDEIYRHFRKFKLSYELNDIIAFLDKRCITFKTKEQSYSKRHQKKKNRATQET